MSQPDVFGAALDVVIEALKTRLHSGTELKASASDLSSLRAVSVVTAAGGPSKIRSEEAPTQPQTKHASKREDGSPPIGKRHERQGFIFPALPEIQEGSTREEKLSALRDVILPCVRCEQLASTRRHVVFGEGAPEAALMFVCDSPGVEEDEQGRPFAGEAGALLDKMLLAMGLSRGEVYLTSVLKCRPNLPPEATGSRPPTTLELSNCAPYLASQIAIIKPKIIVAMGAGAMHALFGSTETVGKLRSHWHDLQGIPVMPTFHPSYLIRNQSNTEKRKVWEDLLQVMERLGFSISEKQRGFFKPRTTASGA